MRGVAQLLRADVVAENLPVFEEHERPVVDQLQSLHPRGPGVWVRLPHEHFHLRVHSPNALPQVELHQGSFLTEVDQAALEKESVSSKIPAAEGVPQLRAFVKQADPVSVCVSHVDCGSEVNFERELAVGYLVEYVI